MALKNNSYCIYGLKYYRTTGIICFKNINCAILYKNAADIEYLALLILTISNGQC